MKTMIRTFEAFAGYGSQTVSLKRANKNPMNVGISEVDKYAIVAYDAIHGTGDVEEQTFEYMQKHLTDRNIGFDFKKNKSTLKKNEIESLYRACIRTKNYGDISLINPTELSDIDLFTYSFPCQDISLAGNQKGITEETRSGLLWECLKIIKAKKPKFLFMENVKNLVGKKFKPDFNKWCEELEELGYNNVWQVVNAKDDGIPQNRERVFMVSTLKKTEFKFKPKQELKIFLKDILEENVDEKYFLSKTMLNGLILNGKKSTSGMRVCDNVIGNTKSGGENSRIYGKEGIVGALKATEYKQPKQIAVACAQQGRDIENPKLRIAGKKTSQRIESAHWPWSNCLTGVQKDSLVMVGLLDMKGSEQCRRVYDPKGLSPTLNTMQGGNRQPKILNELRIRKLTPLECFRLMGMRDDDFYKIKKALNNTFHKGADRSNSQLYKLAGNSIVVDCMMRVWNWRD